MKKMLSAALALSLLAGTAAVAQPYDNHRNDRHDSRSDNRNDNRHDARAHRWTRGERLPASYRTRSHYVDYRRHHLRQPPRGYQWVQVDNNYALIALTSGLISQLIAAQ
jgi:Ni/Co efflux regulator RcnB